MIGYKSRHSTLYRSATLVLECLFLTSDLSFCSPQININAAQSTLAAESRLEPFLEKHGLDFRNISTVIYAIRSLRKLIIDDHADDEAMPREINRLNRLFSDGAVNIEEQIKIDRLQGSNEKGGQYYTCAVFHFNARAGNGKVIKALFLKDYPRLTSDELRQLGITDVEKYVLDCPGLEGVWFVDQFKDNENTEEQLKEKAQEYINILSRGDNLAGENRPDVFQLLGNPDAEVFVEFAKMWKKQFFGTPMLCVGGYGFGTREFIAHTLAYYKKKDNLTPVEEAWLKGALEVIDNAHGKEGVGFLPRPKRPAIIGQLKDMKLAEEGNVIDGATEAHILKYILQKEGIDMSAPSKAYRFQF